MCKEGAQVEFREKTVIMAKEKGKMKKNVAITTVLVVFLILSGLFLALPPTVAAADQAAVAGTWNARGQWADGG